MEENSSVDFLTHRRLIRDILLPGKNPSPIGIIAFSRVWPEAKYEYTVNLDAWHEFSSRDWRSFLEVEFKVLRTPVKGEVDLVSDGLIEMGARDAEATEGQFTFAARIECHFSIWEYYLSESSNEENEAFMRRRATFWDERVPGCFEGHWLQYDDPKDTYEKFCYPSVDDLHVYLNLVQLQHHKLHWDRLHKKRGVHHRAGFPTKSRADACERNLRQHGFKTARGKEVDDAFSYRILASRNMSLDEDRLNEDVILLHEVVEHFGGVYDGWVARRRKGLTKLLASPKQLGED